MADLINYGTLVIFGFFKENDLALCGSLFNFTWYSLLYSTTIVHNGLLYLGLSKFLPLVLVLSHTGGNLLQQTLLSHQQQYLLELRKIATAQKFSHFGVFLVRWKELNNHHVSPFFFSEQPITFYKTSNFLSCNIQISITREFLRGNRFYQIWIQYGNKSASVYSGKWPSEVQCYLHYDEWYGGNDSYHNSCVPTLQFWNNWVEPGGFP